MVFFCEIRPTNKNGYVQQKNFGTIRGVISVKHAHCTCVYYTSYSNAVKDARGSGNRGGTKKRKKNKLWHAARFSYEVDRWTFIDYDTLITRIPIYIHMLITLFVLFLLTERKLRFREVPPPNNTRISPCWRQTMRPPRRCYRRVLSGIFRLENDRTSHWPFAPRTTPTPSHYYPRFGEKMYSDGNLWTFETK